MATSTQEFTSLSNIVKALVMLSQADAVAYNTQVDVINQAYNGPYASQIAAYLSNIRKIYGTILSAYSEAIKLQIVALVQTTDIDGTAAVTNFNDAVAFLRKWMYDNSTVLVLQPQTSTMVAAGTNVGDGTAQIITVDKYGFNLSNIYNGVAIVRCITDQTMNVNAGNEIFQVFPENEGTDVINAYGTSRYGTKTTQKSLNPLYDNLVPGGFFRAISQVAGVVSDLGNDWDFVATEGALTDLIASTATYWRADNQISVLFANTSGGVLGADKTITIYNTIAVNLKANLPYTGYLVYANETNGAAADVYMKVGTSETTVALPDVSGVAGAATRLEWKKDEDSYLDNFKPVPTTASDNVVYVYIKVVLKAGMADGAGVRIHGIMWNQCGTIGKCPILWSGGSIDFVKDDYWTFTNTYTAAGVGKNIQALRDQLGITLPSKPTGTGGYTVIADPA